MRIQRYPPVSKHKRRLTEQLDKQLATELAAYLDAKQPTEIACATGCRQAAAQNLRKQNHLCGLKTHLLRVFEALGGKHKEPDS